MENRKLNVVIFFELSFLFVIEAVKSQDPFYIVAHMANSRAAIDWAVSQGANAIENDLQFDDNGNPTIFEHGDLCDCVCAILSHHICIEVLDRKCKGPEASDDAATYLQYAASYNSIALYYVDSKVEAKWGDRLIKAGSTVVPFIDRNLFNYGYKGKVIISSAKIDTYDYIQAAVIAANNSANREHYFFTFDEEGNNYQGDIAMLSRLTNNRMRSTGASSCSLESYDSSVNDGVAGKIAGENSMTLVWTIDIESIITKYINLGVQGILTNRVAVLKQIVDSMNLTIANAFNSIPASTVNLSSPDKCNCSYNNGGCTISWPAPSGKACKCRCKGIRMCDGSLVSCDPSQLKCANPDESKEACHLGQGNCNGY